MQWELSHIATKSINYTTVLENAFVLSIYSSAMAFELSDLT